MTEKNITLADDVLALLKQRAEAEGVSVDEVATEAVRIGRKTAGGGRSSRRAVVTVARRDTARTTSRASCRASATKRAEVKCAA